MGDSCFLPLAPHTKGRPRWPLVPPPVPAPFGFERNYRRQGAGEHTVRRVVLPPKENRRYAFMDSFTFAGKVR